MSKYSCERCGKDFSQKSHYDSHKRRKKPCENYSNKIQTMVDKKVKEEKTAFEKYTGVTNPRTEGRKSNYATDDEDEEGANKNIIMQLYKAISLRGRFDVVFDDGKKEKVKEPIAQKAIAIHRTFRTSKDRLAFQNKISKYYRDLLNAIR